MHATSIFHTIALGTCLVAATLTARTAGSRFEAHTTGAKTLTLRGLAAAGMQALVVTGPPDASTGAYRARGGRLTITRSNRELIKGRFEIDAVGFDAAEPTDEDQELTVFGKFSATPTAPERTSRPEVELLL